MNSISWLNSLEKIGIHFGLERIQSCLDFFDNPEKKLKVIHIAGTNGKGSTAAFVSKILEVAGYSVGLYISPHLQDVRERIQINGQYIEKDEFIRLLREVRSVGTRQALSLQLMNIPNLTYFEVLTAVALKYFQKQKVDFAVVEVGMGGRLDATNAVENVLVSVITNIDYEHTDYLGTTLSQIAGEKAGIIKEGGTVITGAKGEAWRRISEVCAERKAKLFSLGEEFTFNTVGARFIEPELSGSDESDPYIVKKYSIFFYSGINQNFTDLEVGILGEHQYENAALSIAVAEVLINQGIKITEENIRRGLKEVYWPGRMELFQCVLCKEKSVIGSVRLRRIGIEKNQILDNSIRNPKSEIRNILLDGAHNPAGMKVLRDNLIKKVIPYRKLILVIGILKDKNIPAMLAEILPIANEIILTQPNNERACPINRLKDVGSAFIKAFSNISSALQEAFCLASEQDLICVTGSLYLVGEARTIIKQLS